MKRHTAAVVQNMTFHDSARLDLVTYEDRISIPTPEGVELELVLAGVGSRLVATVIDYLVKGAILLALWIIGTAVGGDEVGGFLLAGLVVASFLVWFGYDVAFETLASGRTPGKRAAGLRVVLASSGDPGHLDHYFDLLRARDLVEEHTTARDAEHTKPDPDLVTEAWRRSPAYPTSSALT